MNKSVAVVFVVALMAAVATAELLAALRKLEQSPAFHTLSQQDQIYLIDIIAAAETCKLTDLSQIIGRNTIIRVVSHLPATAESTVETYLRNHEAAEKNGTCTVQ